MHHCHILKIKFTKVSILFVVIVMVQWIVQWNRPQDNTYSRLLAIMYWPYLTVLFKFRLRNKSGRATVIRDRIVHWLS